jgi:mevalonate kinase
MITLCGRVTNIPMISHETSTEEEFEVIKFVENNAPFPLLLGKTWIEKDQFRRKAEEEATKQKKKELRDFITRKIERLIEEQEDKLKQQRARELAVEVERMQEGLKNLFVQERSIATSEIVREGTLTLESIRAHQQCEVLSPEENKNTKGKRIP